MDKLERGDTLDRLSELPDSLILKILSSLEMREVVRTTFLSKRWTDLWTTIPCLCFVYDHISHDNQKQIQNFINQALFLWKGSRIQKFELCLSGYIRESLCRDMNWWLRFVTEKKLEELYLDLPSNAGPIPLPHFLFECSSIRKLSIVGDCNLNIRGDMHWNQLKSLTIGVFSVTEEVINQVLSGVPQLEIFDLSIYGHYWKIGVNLSIRSSSLKRLSICHSYGQYDPLKHAVLAIWAPDLEELVISGALYNKCLMMDVPSLRDVSLDFKNDSDVAIGETMRQILPAFQHVKVVTLSSRCFKVLGAMKGKFSFSPLPNVDILRFDFDLIERKYIVGLLVIFPKVKMLAITRIIGYLQNQDIIGELLTAEEDILMKSLLMQLRTVKIRWPVNMYENSMFQFIEFILKHATVLEKMVIQKIDLGRWVVENEERQKLLSLQRSFPTVNLKILPEDGQINSVF